MRYLSAIIFLLLIASCNKGRRMCMPAPDDNLGDHGFVVKDSNGQNLLSSSAKNRLDTAIIRVTQPCSEEKGRIIVENNIFYFDAPLCSTVLVQWQENDVDTITYTISTGSNSCSGTRAVIDPKSIRVNGQTPEQDTIMTARYQMAYIIRK